ncbi:MAG: hypothetical protein HY362_04350 [Candidatus Aenigmarchaeota archaeon]|nr:hypothetical protein [Candidatus Aenigmarchaeota archaeon]
MAVIIINDIQTWKEMLSPLQGEHGYVLIRPRDRVRDRVWSSNAYMGKLERVYTGSGCEVNHANVELMNGVLIKGNDGPNGFHGFEQQMKRSVCLGDMIVMGAGHIDEALARYSLSTRDYDYFVRSMAPERPVQVARRVAPGHGL